VNAASTLVFFRTQSLVTRNPLQSVKQQLSIPGSQYSPLFTTPLPHNCVSAHVGAAHFFEAGVGLVAGSQDEVSITQLHLLLELKSEAQHWMVSVA
jgi:hypothetical protein